MTTNEQEALKWIAAGAQRTADDIAASRKKAEEMGRVADAHAALIAQDGWEDDGERGRR